MAERRRFSLSNLFMNVSKFNLEFEKPIKYIEDEIESLKNSSNLTGIDLKGKINELTDKLNLEYNKIYSNLNRWQKVELARHPDRPHTSDYIKLISNNWIELHGDRKFSDDPSIIAGICNIDDESCIIIGHEKDMVLR